jgi:hypothetical protein
LLKTFTVDAVFAPTLNIAPQNEVIISTWRSTLEGQRRYLPLQDDIASTAFWYQTEPHAAFPVLPDVNFLEVI